MLTSDLGKPRAVLLDTNIWVWASGNAGGPSRFARRLAPQSESAASERRLYVCAASVWEIALKAQSGDLVIAGNLHEWVRGQREHPGVRILTLNSGLAIDATTLPPWVRRSDRREHKNPNDRFLVAAARRLGAVLVTSDEVILDYAREGHLLACDARP